MNRLYYLHKPIGSISSLAKALSLEFGELTRLVNEVDTCYRLNPIEKPDGSYRDTYAVSSRLKVVQSRILQRICRAIVYPPYLFAVKDDLYPRSDIADAASHTSAQIIVRLDIRDFFPSIKAPIVLRMWRHLFHFPEDVARVLTQLTTYRGCVPQGSPTSSAIACFVFWDREPEVVAKLEDRGFQYTRYIDDITISSDQFVDQSDLEPIIRLVYGMFANKGVRPHRHWPKMDISTHGHRLQVHKLNVNADRPTMPAEIQARIRAAVKQCELKAKCGRTSPEYAKLWCRTHGRVQRMRQLGIQMASRYLKRLKAISPVPPL